MCDIRTESVVLEEAHKALRARLGHATPSWVRCICRQPIWAWSSPRAAT